MELHLQVKRASRHRLTVVTYVQVLMYGRATRDLAIWQSCRPVWFPYVVGRVTNHTANTVNDGLVNFEWPTSLARANQPEAQAAPQASSQG